MQEPVKVKGCFISVVNWLIGLTKDIDLTFKKNNSNNYTAQVNSIV